MAGIRTMAGQVWTAARWMPRLLIAVVAFVLRAPRLVLESGGQLDHRNAVDEHLRAVWGNIESELRAAGGGHA